MPQFERVSIGLKNFPPPQKKKKKKKKEIQQKSWKCVGKFFKK
jgi:hypothetical protein